MDYKTANDKVLWERCRADDQRAFDEIFERYSHQMHCYVSRYVKDGMIAEELVMDCFFTLWTQRRHIDDGNFWYYLLRCAYNSVASHLRKNLPSMVDLEKVEYNLESENSTDSHLISTDIQGIYRAALERMTPRRRQAFLLSREENLSYADIAKKMNLSTGTVENHMVAALEFMRVSMAGHLSTLLVLLSSLVTF